LENVKDCLAHKFEQLEQNEGMLVLEYSAQFTQLLRHAPNHITQEIQIKRCDEEQLALHTTVFLTGVGLLFPVSFRLCCLLLRVFLFGVGFSPDLDGCGCLDLVGGGAHSTWVFLSSVSSVSHRRRFLLDLVLTTASGSRCRAGAFRGAVLVFCCFLQIEIG
jgi:hypothetical protein